MSVKKLSIHYVDSYSERSFTRFYDDMTPWTEMIQDVAKLLESAGYIKVVENLGVVDSPFLNDEWQGNVMFDDGTWGGPQ